MNMNGLKYINLTEMPSIKDEAAEWFHSKWRGPKVEKEHISRFDGFDIEFTDYVCPCQCDDGFYNWMPKDDWFCANGERRE